MPKAKALLHNEKMQAEEEECFGDNESDPEDSVKTRMRKLPLGKSNSPAERKHKRKNKNSQKEKRKQRKAKTRLLVGEGDCHYSVALTEKHPEVSKSLIATEYESEEALSQRKNFLNNKKTLKDSGVKLLFGVDGRTIGKNQRLRNISEHIPRIHFNFPHDRSSWSDSRRTLYHIMIKFFNSSSELQEKGDQIHVVIPKRDTRAKDNFFQGYFYGLADASLKAGYRYIGKREFNTQRYPGYQHNQTGNSQVVSVAHNAREHVFRKVAVTDAEKKALRESSKFPKAKRSFDSEETFNYLPEIKTANESTDYYEKEIDESHLLKLLKDKCIVVKTAEDLTDEGLLSTLAKTLTQVTKESHNHYWDIDGGFQAIALLGNHFKQQHAEYIKKRVIDDPSWRKEPALEAMKALATRINHPQAISAMLDLMYSLFRYGYIKAHDIQEMYASIGEGLFQRECLHVLAAKINTPSMTKYSSMSELLALVKKNHVDAIRFLRFMKIVGLTSEVLKKLLDADDESFQITREADKVILRKLFSSPLSPAKKILKEKEWLGLKNCLKKQTLPQSRQLKQFKRAIITSLKDRNKVVEIAKFLLSHEIMTQKDLATFLLSTSTKPDNPMWWPIDGGFESMSLLGNAFTNAHAEYIQSSILSDPTRRLTYGIDAIENLLNTTSNLLRETRQTIVTLLEALKNGIPLRKKGQTYQKI